MDVSAWLLAACKFWVSAKLRFGPTCTLRVISTFFCACVSVFNDKQDIK